MKKKPQHLEFDFDDSESMDDILGYGSDAMDEAEKPTRKQRMKALGPVSPLELGDEMDMDALLAQGDEPDLDDVDTEEPEEEPGMPADIFGTMSDNSMQDLLTTDAQREAGEGHISDISISGSSVTLFNGQQGFLDKSEFPDWSAVQIGDSVLVDYKQDDPGPELALTLINHEPRPMEATSAKGRPSPSAFDGFKPGTRFVLDASNICRSFSESAGSSLAPLLSLVADIMEHDGDCVCVFDANERYVLGENRQERNSTRVYEELLEDLSKQFIEAPATGTADDYLLKIAHRERLAVISNDRFDKAADRHREQYPWLVPGGSRLIRGRVDGDRIHIPRLKLAAPLSHDLTALTQRIKLMVMGRA